IHVVMCRLSNRQRYLYDDFMSRAKTRETLQTGNLLSQIDLHSLNLLLVELELTLTAYVSHKSRLLAAP
ncbi:hypothetical protein DOY81_013620, partial [Sarcophaga bullata]